MRPKWTISAVLVAAVASTAFLITPEPKSAQAQVKLGPAKRELPKKLYKPRDVVALAAKDAQTIADGDVRKYCRYLTLYNIHPDDREAYIKLLNFACNSLSRRRTMVFVTPVDTENVLVRLQIDQYEWENDVWDNLGRQGSGPIVSVKKLDQPEPYFHEITRTEHTPTVKKTRQVLRPNGYGGQTYVTETYEEKGPKQTKVELAHASWIEAKDIAALALSVESDYPIYRADWFISNALLAPAYYKFLGVKTLEDFQKLVRFRKRDDDLAIKGIVTDSLEVALHQRAARFIPTALGSYWETYDYFTSVGDDNLLKNLLNEKRDAGEIIANLPNSLQAYALVNDKDAIIDFADPNVAIDMITPWKNKLVWTGYSCMTCHSEGMKDVADEVRVLSRPPFALLAKKKDDFKKVIDLFSTPIEEPINTTKTLYKRSVFLATKGLTPQQNAANLQKFFITYQQKNLDLFDAALEVGCPPDQIRDILGRTVGPDHTLTQLLAGRPVRRDQWEAAGFSQLCVLTVNSK